MNRSLLVLLVLVVATVVGGRLPSVHAAPAPAQSSAQASEPGYWAMWTEAASH